MTDKFDKSEKMEGKLVWLPICPKCGENAFDERFFACLKCRYKAARVLVAGSRTITDYNVVRDAIVASGYEIGVVVSGGAKGVDRLGEKYARAWKITIKPFIPDWEDLSHSDARIRRNRWGKLYDANAGMRRNSEMVAFCDKAVVVWDGRSNGTLDTINKLEESGKPYFVVNILKLKNE